MTPEQSKWLTQLTGKSAQRSEIREINQKRDAVRAMAQQSVNETGAELFSNMNLMASDGEKKQRLLNYGVRDQRTEFDIDDQQDGFTLTSDEDTGKHLKAARMVGDLSTQFDTEVEVVDRDDDGNPKLDSQGAPLKKKQRLFDEKQLGEELYEPLVRQGLLPETFVPDEHSKTHEMLEESFKAYRERLDQDHIKNPIKRFWAENKALIKTTATSGIALASQSIKADGLTKFDMQDALDGNALTWGKELSEGKADNVVEMTAMAFDFLSDKLPEAGGDIAEGVKGRIEKNQAKNGGRLREITKFTNLAIAAAAEKVGAAMAPYQLQASAAAAFSSAVKPAAIIAALAPEELSKTGVDAAALAFIAGFGKALRGADPKVGESTRITEAAVSAVSVAFAQQVGSQALVTALTPAGKEDYGRAMTLVTNGAAQALAAALSSTEFKDMLTTHSGLINEKLGAQVAEDMVQQASAEDEKAEQELAALSLERDDEARAGLLERKLQSMERDEKLVKWASSLAGMGFDIASKFFAPMAIAGSALKLAMNITAAAKRYRDFIVFSQKQADMFRAASPYSAAVDNFIYNADVQNAHYTAVAALELVNMIGAIVETAGMASGLGAAAGVVAGKALQASAAAGQAIEAVIYEAKKRYDVEKAWTTYRIAVLRPDNRKLRLIAQSMNPTLAKYAIAWGAVIKKDPLVSDFMGACGLNEATLRDEKSNVDLVHTYMEKRFSDDSVITGRLPVSNEWQPPNLTLSAQSWTALIRRAVKDAELVQQEGDTRPVELALAAFEPEWKKLQEDCAAALKPGATVQKPAPEAFKSCETKLLAVDAALLKYKPRRTVSGGTTIEHRQMVEVLKNFGGLIEARRKEIEQLAA